jgi:tubulin monoglycylase TTLL15
MGLEKIVVKSPSNFPTNWDLLWTFKHQENLKAYINWSDIKYHQKVNHFPGNYMLVSKSYLTTQDDFDFIPKGFLTSEDVQEYAAEHPEKRFVLKLKSNRGVKLVKPSEMNFSETDSLEDYFAQEYLEDPLLWNGYKFDFSIFVVITSVNPLRFYYYNKNVNLRFCLKPYSTANISDLDAYVIGSNHTPGQVFPYVKKYIDAGYTYRDAFEGYIQEIGGDLDHIWHQVENVIRSTVLTKEEYMINGVSLVSCDLTLGFST